MDANNKKKSNQKSSEDLIDSKLSQLNSEDPTHIAGPIISFDENNDSRVDRVLINPISNKNGSDWNETRVMPSGIDNATAVFQKPSQEVFASDEKSAIIQGIDFSQQAIASKSGDDKTAIIYGSVAPGSHDSDSHSSSEKTMVVDAKDFGARPSQPIEEKISFGVARPSTRTLGSASASEGDSRVEQAENLRVAQERLLQLEAELERLREENEQLSSASSAAKDQLFEVGQKAEKLEQELARNLQQYSSEIEIYRDSASHKEVELIKSRSKISELESRLRQDLRKIRVRERELENRLELTRMEKEALLRAKDDAILDLKRKFEQQGSEVEGYRQLIIELNQRIEANSDQFSRTVRALRLALTNLEVNDAGSTKAPILKKAE